MKARGAAVPIPVDVVVRQGVRRRRAGHRQGRRRRRRRRPDPRHRPADRRAAGASMIAAAGTIVWNGPVGVFEFDAFADGTETIARGDRRSRRRSRIAGGGDTLAAIAKYGIERRHRLHLHRRRRVPRVPRRQDAAGGRDPASSARAGVNAQRTGRRATASRALPIRARRHRPHAPQPPRSSPPSARRRATPEVLERMIRAGVDVVRLNFSHGTAQDHIDRAHAGARDRAQSVGREVGDHGRPAGPEDPRRQVRGRQGHARAGRDVRPRRRHASWATSERVGLDYKELPRDVKPGDTLLLNDGLIVLDGRRGARRARCTPRSCVGGELSNNKGINSRAAA